MRVRLLGIYVVLVFISWTARAAKYPVTILNLHDMQHVPYRPCLVASGPRTKNDYVAIIHPTLWRDYFPQPPISWLENERFTLIPYIGEQNPASSANETFEVQIFEDPKHLYHDGVKLGAFPSSGAVSPMVRVVRDDSAPDGCDQAGPAGSASNPNLATPSASAGLSQTSSSASPKDWPTADRRYLQIALYLFSAIALLMIFPLVRLTERTASAGQRIGGYLTAFLLWLGDLGARLTQSVTRLGGWLGPKAVTAVSIVFNAHGYQGNLRKWGLSLMILPIVLLGLMTAFYAEAHVIRLGLLVAFTEESIAGSSVKSSFFDDLPTSAASSITNDVQVDIPVPKTSASLDPSRGVVGRSVELFQKLWDESLGPIAIGLAALEGAFGIVVLVGVSASEMARLHPKTLFAQRPLVSTLFLAFDVALAIMAAIRGYELSPTGSNPWAPSILAGLISLCLAPMMAFCAHFAVECAGDQFAMVQLAALTAGVALGSAVVLVGWVVIALTIFVCANAVFLAYALPAAGLLVYLKCIELYGELIAAMKAPPFRIRPVAAEALSALLGGVILFISGYLLTKGHTL